MVFLPSVLRCGVHGGFRARRTKGFLCRLVCVPPQRARLALAPLGVPVEARIGVDRQRRFGNVARKHLSGTLARLTSLLRVLGRLTRDSGDEGAARIAVVDTHLPIHLQEIHLLWPEVFTSPLFPVPLPNNLDDLLAAFEPRVAHLGRRRLALGDLFAILLLFWLGWTLAFCLWCPGIIVLLTSPPADIFRMLSALVICGLAGTGASHVLFSLRLEEGRKA